MGGQTDVPGRKPSCRSRRVAATTAGSVPFVRPRVVARIASCTPAAKTDTQHTQYSETQPGGGEGREAYQSLLLGTLRKALCLAQPRLELLHRCSSRCSSRCSLQRLDSGVDSTGLRRRQYQRSSGLGRKSRSMELYCKLQELLQGNPKISMESSHTVLSTEILKVFLRKTPCFATRSILVRGV